MIYLLSAAWGFLLVAGAVEVLKSQAGFCVWCHRWFARWPHRPTIYFELPGRRVESHGICPACKAKLEKET